MKPTKDARYLINKKRQKGQQTNMVRKAPRGIVDARAILNSKIGQKPQLVRTSASGVFTQRKQFPLKRKPVQSTSHVSAHAKRVQVSRDGNIVITAKPRNAMVERGPAVAVTPRWTPSSDIETASVEHLGIDDVLDMDALPSAPLTRPAPAVRISSRVGISSLADEMAEMQNTMIADQLSSSQQPVCVCVSNLHSSVSKQDVIELFGDIGAIRHAEMPQQGVALIEYFDPNDAVRACDLYHQRLLDGQAMMCQVQTHAPKRSLVSQRLGGKVQPPIFPLSAAAASRSIHNPRNVRFTVKLS